MVLVRTGFLLGLIGAACGRYDDNYILDQSALEAALSLTIEDLNGQAVSSLSADGFSRVTIRVRIDSQAAADKRTVALTTTAGSFLGGLGTEALARKVAAGSDGRGSVQLMSNTTAQAVVITAAIENSRVVRTFDLQFIPPELDSIVRITGLPGTLPANGLATGEVNVAISPYLTGAARNVTFDLAGGTVTPSGASLPDASGNLRVFIQSSRIGPARLAVTAAGFTRDTIVQFRQPTPDEIVRFTEVPASVPADGASLGIVKVLIPAALTGTQREVQFNLVGGTIQAPDKVTATSAGQATAFLKSSEAGNGVLRATAGGFAIDTIVQFVVAAPDSVFLDVGPGSVKVDNNLAVTASLFRIKGKPTAGTVVRFQALDAANVERGHFINVKLSTVDGLASATWVASGVTGLPGVRIVATATASGKADTATVAITP